METIKLDYSGFERVQGMNHYYTLYISDVTGLVNDSFQALAERVVLPFVDGDFFGLWQYDDETGEAYYTISEGLTGARISRGETFKQAFDEALSKFRKYGTKGFQKLVLELSAEGFVSPRYKMVDYE